MLRTVVVPFAVPPQPDKGDQHGYRNQNNGCRRGAVDWPGVGLLLSGHSPCPTLWLGCSGRGLSLQQQSVALTAGRKIPAQDVVHPHQ